MEITNEEIILLAISHEYNVSDEAEKMVGNIIEKIEREILESLFNYGKRIKVIADVA